MKRLTNSALEIKQFQRLIVCTLDNLVQNRNAYQKQHIVGSRNSKGLKYFLIMHLKSPLLNPAASQMCVKLRTLE